MRGRQLGLHDEWYLSLPHPMTVRTPAQVEAIAERLVKRIVSLATSGIALEDEGGGGDIVWTTE